MAPCTMIRTTLGLAVLLFCAGAGFCEDDRLVLVVDGHVAARIVVGDDASPAAEFAAEELRTYVKKCTGAELPVTDDLLDDDLVEIVVGAGKIASRLGVDAEGLPRDAFRIKAVGKRIVILGRDDPQIPPVRRNSARPAYAEHATVFGVYDFIERYLGVRWYLPIDLGEVAPKTTTFSVPVMDITDAPNKIGRFVHVRYGADDRDDPLPLKFGGAYRGGLLPGFAGKEREAFLWRRCVHALRMRYQTTMTTGNHTMWRLIAPKRFSKTHLEYFALFKNGKRGTSVTDPHHAHHCFTNPGAVDEMIRLARAAFRGEDAKKVGLRSWNGIVRETAKGKAFHILQDDAYKPCFCTTCEEFRKESGLEAPESETEIVWSMVIKVANAVRQEFPNCVVSAAAYGPMKYPPKQKMPDNILISGLAVSGPYAEFVPGMRELNDERVERWIKTVGGERIAGFYEYALKGGWEHGVYKSHKSICGSIPRAYASYYRRMKDTGQGTYMYLMCHRFAYDHLSQYVFYKYHWNPDRDINALLREYYSLFYGPAASPMGRFWGEVEQQFKKVITKTVETPLGPSTGSQDEQEIWGVIYGPAVMKRWNGYFADAARLTTSHASSVYARRVAYMKRNVLETIEEGFREYHSILARAKKTRLVARRTQNPPVIDGKLNDSAWRAAEVGRFQVMNTLEVPSVRTSLRLAWDDQNLYVAMDCHEPNLDSMDASETVTDRAQVWRNNGVEIFFDPNNEGRTHYQWLFNHKGTWADTYKYAAKKMDFGWNSAFEAKVLERADGYVVEMAIPFKAMPKGAPQTGDTWGANFVRKRWPQGVKYGQSTYLTWSPLIGTELGFHRGIAFGKVDFRE